MSTMVEKSSKILTFSGKIEDWNEWSEKFKASPFVTTTTELFKMKRFWCQMQKQRRQVQQVESH